MGNARGNSTTDSARLFDEAMARNDKLLEKAYKNYLPMSTPEEMEPVYYRCSKTRERGLPPSLLPTSCR